MSYEIERKYLIEKPNGLMENCTSWSSITQTYLSGEDGAERVRARVTNGRTTYTHTYKKAVSAIKRIENERELDEAEYRALLTRADTARRPIEKVRYLVDYMGKIFEIDIYDFFPNHAIMEIELADECESFLLPPFIKIVREVTDDPAFTNSAMAKSIPII